MTRREKLVRVGLTLLALGYGTAALSYSYFLGRPTVTFDLCLLCPHLDSIGTPLPKFVQRTFIFGTFNSLLLMATRTLLIFVLLVKDRFSHRDLDRRK